MGEYKMNQEKDEFSYAYRPHIPDQALKAVIEPLKAAVGASVKLKMYNNELRTVKIKAVEDTRTPNGRFGSTMVITETGFINSRVIREVLEIIR